jgi:hypothetical protein
MIKGVTYRTTDSPQLAAETGQVSSVTVPTGSVDSSRTS